MTDPFDIFQAWFAEAKAHPAIGDATAMSLATASGAGRPSVRIVLLKGVEKGGFVFYTNLESRKSVEIFENPHAALCFHWLPLGKQVRVEGKAELVSAAEADAYFASRPRESRLGAWASAQSRPLESRNALEEAVRGYAANFRNAEPARPPHWGGWRLIPEAIEFWQQGDFRLHHRLCYTRKGRRWQAQMLWP